MTNNTLTIFSFSVYGNRWTNVAYRTSTDENENHSNSLVDCDFGASTVCHLSRQTVPCWPGVPPIVYGDSYDDIETYTNGVALSGLDGGSIWLGPYVDRNYYLGLQTLDDIESYTDLAAPSMA